MARKPTTPKAIEPKSVQLARTIGELSGLIWERAANFNSDTKDAERVMATITALSQSIESLCDELQLAVRRKAVTLD